MTTHSLLRRMLAPLALLPALIAATARGNETDLPDYANDVLPILRTYCVGCHYADEGEGGLALDSYAGILKGGERGAVITAKRGDLSRLVRVLTGEAQPAMPPEDNEAPSAEQIAILKAWIDGGAKGPEGGEPDPKILVTPQIEPSVKVRQAVTAIAVSSRGDVAVARYGAVELFNLSDESKKITLHGHRGNVNAVSFSTDGNHLIAAAGEAGLFGEARLWSVPDGKLIRVFEGHSDSLYAAELSPDSSLLATGGYDQQIILWDVASGARKQTLEGHNGAVFGLAFRPDGKILASASGDRTVKLWRVDDGARLDTLNQSLQELYTVAFSPNGAHVAAAGVDNRIRVWRVSQSGDEGSNPLLHSVFAHDAPILRLVYSPDGRTIVSAAQDRLVKTWNTRSMTLAETLPPQSDWPAALAVSPDSKILLFGCLDGQIDDHQVQTAQLDDFADVPPAPELPPLVDYPDQPPLDQLPRVDEVEPNDAADQAVPLPAPAVAVGKIHSDRGGDADLFRFTAAQGEQWILETKAARDKSPLDSKIEVLDAEGRPIERVLLRAVRDSELEFRGMNSEQRGARLKNWEEKLLNEYIYIGGEVVKHYQQRRGPDSDAQFYPEGGGRHTYFETTAHAHALGEPAYVVVPYPPGTELPDNGLPVFPVYFENDDEATRALGSDSRLTFVAPAAGEYLVRVSDVRGFSGEDFKYELTVRRPQPGIQVTIAGKNPTVNAGSGKQFTVKAERIDNYGGPIRVDISGAPPGFSVTSPVIIEAGHREAHGVINAHPFAPPSTEANWAATQVTAFAEILGRDLEQQVAGGLGTVKLAEKPKLTVKLFPTGGEPRTFVAPPKRVWTVLDPAEFSAKSDAKLEKLEDHSLLVSGENPDNDAYTVLAGGIPAGVRAIRLEALGHEKLPSSAPGRAEGNGNFVLSEITASIISPDQPGESRSLKFAGAAADHSQAGWPVAGAIDGDPKTGWAIAQEDKEKKFPVPRIGDDPRKTAVFELEQPLELKPGERLQIILEHSAGPKQHNLGRFRLSASNEPPVDPSLEFPPIPEIAMAPGTTITCQLQVVRDGFNDRIAFDVNNLPHGVIVDNIGLNGVLIPEGDTQRTLYLTAEPWVADTSRLFHAVANVEGSQVSLPMLLHVRRPAQVASAAGGE